MIEVKARVLEPPCLAYSHPSCIFPGTKVSGPCFWWAGETADGDAHHHLQLVLGCISRSWFCPGLVPRAVPMPCKSYVHTWRSSPCSALLDRMPAMADAASSAALLCQPGDAHCTAKSSAQQRTVHTVQHLLDTTTHPPV